VRLLSLNPVLNRPLLLSASIAVLVFPRLAMATTSTRVIPQKRARLDDTIGSLAPTASEDVSASRAAQNTALSLPTELIYTILAISIGDYLADMMLYPSKIMPWDAILTFLHVSRSFRGSTIKMLYHLWGETFIRQRTRYSNVGPLSALRQFR
jgi:hypothetical protein